MVTCVKIRVLDVPQVVKAGTDVTLTCDYDLGRQNLYTIKWYKGRHEFYRYTPGEAPRYKIFAVENLNVNVSCFMFSICSKQFDALTLFFYEKHYYFL